jgi:hypothetical protein
MTQTTKVAHRSINTRDPDVLYREAGSNAARKHHTIGGRGD